MALAGRRRNAHRRSVTISISPIVRDLAYPEAFSITPGQTTTVAIVAAGGRVSTDSPDWLRRLLARRGLAFATSDNGARGTAFKLIR